MIYTYEIKRNKYVLVEIRDKSDKVMEKLTT